jgi:hypothetical protein
MSGWSTGLFALGSGNHGASSMSHVPVRVFERQRRWLFAQGRELALPAAMALGLALLLQPAGTFLISEWDRATTLLVVGAMVFALLARRAGRPGVALGVACATCACPSLEAAIHTYGFTSPSRYGDEAASTLLATGPLLLWVCAALAAASTPRGVPWAAGLVLFADHRSGSVAVSFALVCVSTVIDGDGDRRISVAERLSLFAVGLLASFAVLGLTQDAAATIAPSLDLYLRHWSPDDPSERAVRMVAELATVSGACGFLRGRTWGALTLGAFGMAMAGCARWFRGPMWGGGCLAYSHALYGEGWFVVALVLIALAPWMLPITRALLRGGSSNAWRSG